MSKFVFICSWIRQESLRLKSCFLIQYLGTSCWWNTLVKYTYFYTCFTIFCYKSGRAIVEAVTRTFSGDNPLHPLFILPGNKAYLIFLCLQYCHFLAGIEFPLILHLLWHAGGNMNFRKSMCWDMRQEWSYEPLSHLEFIGNTNSHRQHPPNPSWVLACQYKNIRFNAILPTCCGIKLSVSFFGRLLGQMTQHSAIFSMTDDCAVVTNKCCWHFGFRHRNNIVQA